MRSLKPIFIENSKIPFWLSKFTPIQIGAITLGFVVLSKYEMDERVKRHETIHFQQFLETLFIGFLLMYLWDYIFCYLRYADGEKAYMMIRAEQEAYANEDDPDYLKNRKRWAWMFKRIM